MGKKREDVDYEQLYYQLKKEMATMTKVNVTIEFTPAELDLLTNIMYEELHHLKDRTFFTEQDDEDEDDPMRKMKPKKDTLLFTIIEEKKTLMESITRKLRLEKQ
jgi:hypothetical protein